MAASYASLYSLIIFLQLNNSDISLAVFLASQTFSFERLECSKITSANFSAALYIVSPLLFSTCIPSASALVCLFMSRPKPERSVVTAGTPRASASKGVKPKGS